MRLERIKRWQWVVISVLVGLALAYARRGDLDNLPSRLGEGVASQRWFERQVQWRVTLADGSTLPAFSRLTVYPLSIRERGRRRPVHVVAGMYLAHVDAPAGPSGPSDATTRPAPAATGKLRPFFFIAPVPYAPLADARRAGPPAAGGTVRTWLDGLRDKGVSYRYAWWADARYATAAWVGGSVVLIGGVWPTAVNLIAFGSFRRPREQKGISLWKVRATTGTPTRPAPAPAVASLPQPAVAAAASTGIAASTHGTDHPATPDTPVRALSLSPVEAAPAAEHEHKEFGAKRDDFYPTELKVHPHKPVPVGPQSTASAGGRHDDPAH